MKKEILLLAIMSLIIFSGVYATENDPNNLGEVISVVVDHYEPISLSSDYLQSRNFPVNVFLKGFTMGSVLFGDDAPEIAPFFGGMKIEAFSVVTRGGTRQYVSGVNPILPRGNKIRMASDGSIDLGRLIVNLRKIEKEEDMPEEIVLNMTAKFVFDDHSQFGIFGRQDIILKPISQESQWLLNPSGDFWSKRGYLRLIDLVGNSRAKLQLYDGSLNPVGGPFELQERKEVQKYLKGAPTFLQNQMRIRLDDIRYPQTKAILVVNNRGIIEENIVGEGMRPFLGSEWYVKDILNPAIVIFTNEDKSDEIHLIGNSSTTRISDPCLEVSYVDESNIVDSSRDERLCSAIKDFKDSIEYSEGIYQLDDLYYSLGQTYEAMSAFLIALDYYKQISPDYDKYEKLEIWMAQLEEFIEKDTTSVVIEGRTIFLKELDIVEDRPYFDAYISLVAGSTPQIQQTTIDQVNSGESLKSYVASMAGKYNVPVDVALGVAAQESVFRHCCMISGKNKAGNCEGDYSNLNCAFNILLESYDGSSHGVFQINKNSNAHPGCYDVNSNNRGICSVDECIGKTAKDLECNVAAGLKFLRDNYDNYKDGIPDTSSVCSSEKNKYLSYRGWDAAIRVYNGVGCPDEPSKSYVEDVNEQMTNFADYVAIGGEGIGHGIFFTDSIILHNLKSGNKNYDWVVRSIDQNGITIRSKGLSSPEEIKTLEIGKNYIDGVYLIDIGSVTTHKEALISVIPGSGRGFGSSDFTLRIPVEKSLIQLTPEQIDKQIEWTSDKIDKLDNTVDRLGKWIKGWKGVCLATYSGLIIKNSFLADPASRKLAVDSYTKICQNNIERGIDGDKYNDLNACLEHFDNIGDLDKAINRSKQAIEDIRSYKTKDFSFEDKESREKVSSLLQDRVDEDQIRLLSNYLGFNPQDVDDLIFLKYNDPSKFEERISSLLDNEAKLKEIDEIIILQQINDPITIKTMVEAKFGDLGSKTVSDRSLADYLKDLFPSAISGNIISTNGIIVLSPETGTGQTFQGVGNDGELIGSLKPVKDENGNQVAINGENLYEKNGVLYLGEYRGGTEYAVEYVNPSIQFNDNKKPWIFPHRFDYPQLNDYLSKDYANYVIINFDDGGYPQSTEIWNVGNDGRLDIKQDGRGDDKRIVHWSQMGRWNIQEGDPNYINIKEDIKSAYNRLDKNPEENDYITDIQGRTYVASYLKSRITDISATGSCLYHMSAKDCELLFNVCDPVMCPASRFNLGGNWPVDNVISTGIIGSMVLGLGNGDIIPFCVSGVNAGLENINTMFKGYEECLQKAKVEGKSTGICKQLSSVYKCEMLWREGMAITNGVGKISDFLSKKAIGEHLLSGGEYSRFRQALDSSDKQIEWFTNDYATSAFSSFLGENSEEFGTELCKAAIYGKVPAGGDFISQLTEPTSPPQFTAWFDEVEVSPTEGTSLYRVYYHIYAGRDKDIKYSVYLKDYVGNIRTITDEDLTILRYKPLNAGDYVDKGFTITDKSGFREICLEIDGNPYCNFGKVTSAFSANWINDKIVKSEIGRNVSSENDCVPDYPRTTPGMGSVPMPSNYGLINSGIVRVCAEFDPDGSGGRWVKQGSCGSESLECYIDTETININDASKYEEVMEELALQDIGDNWGVSYNESEAMREFLDVYYAMGDPSMFVSDSRPSEIELRINELRDIIRYSLEDSPKQLSHKLIGMIYYYFGLLEEPSVQDIITTPTVPPPGPGQNETDPDAEDDPYEEMFKCQIEYEEDSATGVYNLVFGFLDGEWKWKSPDWADACLPYAHPDCNAYRWFRPLDSPDPSEATKQDLYPSIIAGLKNEDVEGGIRLITDATHSSESKGDDYLKIIYEYPPANHIYTNILGDGPITFLDVFQSCDNIKRTYNCVIEYEEDSNQHIGVRANWYFKFEDGTWQMKSKVEPLLNGNRGIFEDKWSIVTEQTCDILTSSSVMKQYSDPVMHILCKSLAESKYDFEEGVSTLTYYANEYDCSECLTLFTWNDDRLIVNQAGVVVYDPSHGDAEETKIHEWCNYDPEKIVNMTNTPVQTNNTNVVLSYDGGSCTDYRDCPFNCLSTDEESIYFATCDATSKICKYSLNFCREDEVCKEIITSSTNKEYGACKHSTPINCSNDIAVYDASGGLATHINTISFDQYPLDVGTRIPVLTEQAFRYALFNINSACPDQVKNLEVNTHGVNGKAKIFEDWINTEWCENNGQFLSSLSLFENDDSVLYLTGCQVGKGDAGESLMQCLSNKLGVTTIASDCNNKVCSAGTCTLTGGGSIVIKEPIVV